MRKEEATSMKIYFNYGYIGISNFQMSGAPDRVWREYTKPILDFMLERVKEYKVSLVVAETTDSSVAFAVGDIMSETNVIVTSIDVDIFDGNVRTYIISDAGLEKEHADVEKRAGEMYCPRTSVVRYSQQGKSEKEIYRTPYNLFSKRD